MSLPWLRTEGLVEQREDIIERRLGGGPIVLLDQVFQAINGYRQLGYIAIRGRQPEQALGLETLQLAHELSLLPQLAQKLVAQGDCLLLLGARKAGIGEVDVVIDDCKAPLQQWLKEDVLTFSNFAVETLVDEHHIGLSEHLPGADPVGGVQAFLLHCNALGHRFGKRLDLLGERESYLIVHNSSPLVM